MGAIKEIGDTIGRMSEISSMIASAVEEQGAATQEISRNIQHAAHGTQQVSSNIADVEHGAAETGSASAQVHAAAKSLSTESNRLKLEVGKFLELGQGSLTFCARGRRRPLAQLSRVNSRQISRRHRVVLR